MKKLPTTENPLVLRTDFSNDAAWESLCTAVQKPVGGFQAYVDFHNDSECDGLTVDQLPLVLPEGTGQTFIFIVDRIALSGPDNPR